MAERRMAPRAMFNMIDHTSYHGYQEYIWFMNGNTNHFQNNH